MGGALKIPGQDSCAAMEMLERCQNNHKAWNQKSLVKVACGIARCERTLFKIHTYTHTYINTYIYTYVRTYIHTSVCTYIYIYIYNTYLSN